MQKAVEDYVTKYEAKNTKTFFTIAGSSGGGGGANGQNVGRGFMALNPWEDREGKENTAQAITQRASRALSGLRDAEVFAVLPPAVRGLGQANGFTIQLLNSGNLSREKFQEARDQLLAAARSDPALAAVRLTELPDQPTLDVKMDYSKLTTLGLNVGDVNNTLSTAWGGRYVNDFVDAGRVKRVCGDGRRALSVQARGSEPVAGARVHRRDGTFLRLRDDRLGQRAEQPLALQRHSFL